MKEKNNLHLEKVSITGFRTIQNLKVKLHPDLNIIIGKNGTGKTNFCEVLYNALTFNSYIKLRFKCNFTIFYEDDRGIDITIQNDTNKESLILRTKNISGIYKNKKYQHLSNPINLHHFSKVLGYSYNTIYIKHGIPSHYDSIGEPLNFTIDHNIFSEELMALVFDQDSLLLKELVVNILTRETFPEDDINIENLEKALSNFEKKTLTIKPHLVQYSNIQDFRLNKNSTIQIDEKQELFHVKNLFFEFQVNDQWLSFEHLSSGTQRMFYIISEIAINSTMAFYDTMQFTNKENNKIIILEEPELGLHPHQLNKLLQFIKEFSKQHQFIITTHSPQVLDMLEPDEVNRILISRIKDGKTKLVKLKAAEIRKAQKYMQEELFLSDYWKYSDLEKEEEA